MKDGLRVEGGVKDDIQVYSLVSGTLSTLLCPFILGLPGASHLPTGSHQLFLSRPDFPVPPKLPEHQGVSPVGTWISLRMSWSSLSLEEGIWRIVQC